MQDITDIEWVGKHWSGSKSIFMHGKLPGRGQDIHPEAAPTQAELHYRWEKDIEEKKRLRKKEKIMEKYGNAASED